MAIESEPAATAPASIQPRHVWIMAAVFLLVGLVIGYLLPEPSSSAASAGAVGKSVAPTLAAGTMSNAHRPSLEEMKQMADTQAAPLLEKLRSHPRDVATLAQLGAVYHITHQFGEAAAWYRKAIEVDPRNVPLRTKLASSLYRSGDVDGALTQLDQALKDEPHDANALFDLGMIRLQGKGDSQGALAAWQQLLRSNPQLSPDRKAVVLKLIAGVMTAQGDQHPMPQTPMKGANPHGAHPTDTE